MNPPITDLVLMNLKQVRSETSSSRECHASKVAKILLRRFENRERISVLKSGAIVPAYVFVSFRVILLALETFVTLTSQCIE